MRAVPPLKRYNVKKTAIKQAANIGISRLLYLTYFDLNVLTVDTVCSSFTCELSFELVWNDPATEDVSDQDSAWQQIWRPELIFKNALEDPMVLCYAVDKLEPAERQVRPVSVKDCNVQLVYVVRAVFREHFELEYFPFDRQFVSVLVAYNAFHDGEQYNITFLDATDGRNSNDVPWRRPGPDVGETASILFQNQIELMRSWTLEVLDMARKQLQRASNKEPLAMLREGQHAKLQAFLVQSGIDLPTAEFMTLAELQNIELVRTIQTTQASSNTSISSSSSYGSTVEDEDTDGDAEDTERRSAEFKFSVTIDGSEHHEHELFVVDERSALLTKRPTYQPHIARLINTLALSMVADINYSANSGITRDVDIHDIEWDSVNPGGLYIRQAESLLSTPVFVMTGKAERKPAFYMWSIVFITILIVSTSVISFRFPAADPSPRNDVNLTLLLTCVAFKMVVAEFLPKTSYLTMLDKFVLVSLLVLFIATIGAASAGLWPQHSDMVDLGCMSIILLYSFTAFVWFGLGLFYPRCLRESWASVVRAQFAQ
jgi:hypothetical protein